MSNAETELNLEYMASCLYRLVEGKPWLFLDATSKKNYMTVCRETVSAVKAEIQQQPVGQKEVA